MTKTNKSPHPTNFWFGFALGTVAAGGAAYLLGTKKGRETLKKILDYCEEHEEDSFEFLKKVQKMVGEHARFSQDSSDKQTSSSHKPQPLNTLEKVIDRISEVTQKKEVKKFFAKS